MGAFVPRFTAPVTAVGVTTAEVGGVVALGVTTSPSAVTVSAGGIVGFVVWSAVTSELAVGPVGVPWPAADTSSGAAAIPGGTKA